MLSMLVSSWCSVLQYSHTVQYTCHAVIQYTVIQSSQLSACEEHVMMMLLYTVLYDWTVYWTALQPCSSLVNWIRSSPCQCQPVLQSDHEHDSVHDAVIQYSIQFSSSIQFSIQYSIQFSPQSTVHIECVRGTHVWCYCTVLLYLQAWVPNGGEVTDTVVQYSSIIHVWTRADLQWVRARNTCDATVHYCMWRREREPTSHAVVYSSIICVDACRSTYNCITELYSTDTWCNWVSADLATVYSSDMWRREREPTSHVIAVYSRKVSIYSQCIMFSTVQ